MYMISLNLIISDKDKTGRQQYVDARNCAESLLGICIEEISTLKYCGDCYMNVGQPNGFTFVCSKPHLLLWVKFENHPYWPAKFVAVKKGPNRIHVQFFGEYTVADVSYQDCYLYSKEDPNEWCTTHQKGLFQEAVNVRIDVYP